MNYDIVIIGGGAAGFFSAIQIAEKNPKLKIIILEKSTKVLEKVKISGGGRCNVTHACFTPKELVTYYPRGNKELLGPFHKFMTGDMMTWLEDNGVETKIEEDGRVFPVSNSSQTIIDLFLYLAMKYKIEIKTESSVNSFNKLDDMWSIKTDDKEYNCNNLVIATGSNRKIWKLLNLLNHKIQKPVPSLFTFQINDQLLKDLPGLSIQNCQVLLKGEKKTESGPILITHKGLSGPAILKLSAWEAIKLAEKEYNFTLVVNWINQDFKNYIKELKQMREVDPKQKMKTLNKFDLPKRFWNKIIEICKLEMKKIAETSNKDLENLANILTKCELKVTGKNTNKAEFVTCGGVLLNEINFKTMESKINNQLFFAGEVVNIDALTGGFNFQNAWTTSFIVSTNF